MVLYRGHKKSTVYQELLGRATTEKGLSFQLVAGVFRQVAAGGLAAGELVAAFVLGVAVVAAHPFQRDAVAVELDLQALPEIAVLDRFLGGGLPAVFPPAREPFFFHGMAQVLRVRVQRDRARLFNSSSPAMAAMISIRLFVVCA